MSDVVTLSVAGATVTVPKYEIKRLWLASVREELAASPPTASTTVPGLPAIGSLWRGGVYAGVYAGIVRGDVGECDYHLVVSTDDAENKTWEAAKAWAANLEHNGNPWELPKRKEQAICYGNVPELFAREWYWSGEEYAPDPAYAWAQSFGYGTQSHYPRSRKFRARAVRRIPIDRGER